MDKLITCACEGNCRGRYNLQRHDELLGSIWPTTAVSSDSTKNSDCTNTYTHTPDSERGANLESAIE